ncbi:hypothetical protein EU528_01990 [Candidatus Thorarchaeota archaeon]|nr:MAG: hypothetical protein EU528_01990 [Candidatus Thorarchaeota archaeon]
MNSEDDTFFEEDDEETTFPDEDIADEDTEEDEDFEEETDFEVRSYEERDTVGWFTKFMADPWPPTVFLITIIGLGIVLFTPPAIWDPNRYGILGVFFLIVAALVGIVFSLITWSRAGTHRLKWAGPVNIAVIVLATGFGVIDTGSWILNGVGMFPELDTPLILLCFMLVFFSLYMLWMIQRSLDPEAR